MGKTKLKIYDLVITHDGGEHIVSSLVRDGHGDFIRTMKEAQDGKEFYLKEGLDHIHPDSIRNIEIKERIVELPSLSSPEA